jgi:hypothetical protein
MAVNLSLVIFFDDGQLKDRRFDRSARAAFAQKMTDAIRSEIPEPSYSEPNPTGCSVNVIGTADVIADVVEFMDRHKELGTYIVDGDLIRSARASAE